MGLFDAFGVGGGSVTIQLQSPMTQAGGMIAGTVTFTGGKRAQNITALKVRLTCTLTQTQYGKQGQQQSSQTQDVVPEFAVSPPMNAQPHQVVQYPFQLQLPPTAPPSQPSVVAYHLGASADIDGEIDPGASVEVTVAPMNVGMGMGMAPGMMPMGKPMMDPKAGYQDVSGAMGNKGMDPKGMGKGMGGGYAPGTHLQAQWTDGNYYGVTVIESKGGMHHVQWDDGTPATWVRDDQVAPG